MDHRFDVLVVGAGHAGVAVIANLTKGAFCGSIGVLGDEGSLPYKRPPLSKTYLLGIESREGLLLRTADYWAQSPATLIPDARVTSVDAARRTVRTESNLEVGFGHLVWAAGGRPRALAVSGADLAGVHSLRTIGDASRLKNQMLSARRAMIVGGGYIGLEIAAAFRAMGLHVTVVEAGARVLERVTSPTVSDFFARVHRDAGVDVRLKTTVRAFRGSGGRLISAALTDGAEMGCDIAVVGIGMQPNVEALAAAGATCSNGVDVDEFGRTDVAGVFAIGDCSNQLNPFGGATRVRLESVQNAGEQAKVVASSLLGRDVPSPEVPWFWSDQYHLKFKSAGIRTGYDSTIMTGDPSREAFSVLYLTAGRLVAIDCINQPANFARARRRIKGGGVLDPSDFAEPDPPLAATVGAVTSPLLVDPSFSVKGAS